MGDREKASLRLQFNPQIRLELHGATITSDAGLLAFLASGLTSVTRRPKAFHTYRIAPAKSASLDTTTACSYSPL